MRVKVLVVRPLRFVPADDVHDTAVALEPVIGAGMTSRDAGVPAFGKAAVEAGRFVRSWSIGVVDVVEVARQLYGCVFVKVED